MLEMYCYSHLIPCCEHCIPTSHSKCTGIERLATAVERMKIETYIQSSTDDIESILHFFEEIEVSKSKNIQNGEQQVQNIKKSIAAVRKHLDQLEKSLCEEVDTILDQEKFKAKQLITEIENKKISLKDLQDHLKTAANLTSKLKSFLAVYTIEKQINQFKRYYEEIENDKRVEEFDFQIKQKGSTEKLLSRLELLESLGKVVICRTETALKKKSQKLREAQVDTGQQTDVCNISLNLERKVDINIMRILVT